MLAKLLQDDNKTTRNIQWAVSEIKNTPTRKINLEGFIDKFLIVSGYKTKSNGFLTESY